MFRKKNNYQKYLKKECPDFVRNYVECFQNSHTENSLYDCRFVVFDTETTGLDIRQDKVISVGAIALENLEICVMDSLELFIERDRTGDKNSVVIHQILAKETRGGYQEIQALEMFLDFIRNSVLVAHYANFDIQMISAILKKHFGFPLLNRYIDTIELARRIDVGKMAYAYEMARPQDYSLDGLCKRYQIPINGRHTAAGDAMATARLLQVLLFKALHKKITYVKEIAQG